ncbi:MAG: 4Fe-4S dicluster domain-containing protein [Spirochaetota bacterium]
MTDRFHRARTVVGLVFFVLFLALPFVSVGGESALRFDVPTLRLHAFGEVIGIQDFFLLLIGLFALVFAAIFLTIYFGRLWCGWACPQTVLLDIAALGGRGRKQGRAVAILRPVLVIALSAAVSAASVSYFVSPFELPALLSAAGPASGLVIGIWAILALLVALELGFIGRKFCAKVCPYAKLQGILFDDRTLVVAYDGARGAECMKCAACAKACPVDIDIRDGVQVECIHCAECVDACTERMARRGKASLVRYSRGIAQPAAKGLRVSLLLTGLLSASFLAFFLFLLLTKAPFDAGFRPIEGSYAALTGSGAVMLQCRLSARNLSTADLELELEASSPSGSVGASLTRFSLPKGPVPLKAAVTLTIRGVTDPSRMIPLTVTLRSVSPGYSIKTSFAAMPRPRK